MLPVRSRRRREVQYIDKQLANIDPHAVQAKIKYGQELTAKEFAVATGMSYPVARGLFKDEAFPAFRRAGAKPLVFWPDWEAYRRRATGSSRRPRRATAPKASETQSVQTPSRPSNLTATQRARTAFILSQVG